MGFNTLVFADVPDESMSRATTLFSMLQQLFLSLGVGTGALLLSLTLNWHHQTALKADDFWPAFAIIGVIAILAVFPLRKLTPDAGAAMSGHRPPEPLKESRFERSLIQAMRQAGRQCKKEDLGELIDRAEHVSGDTAQAPVRNPSDQKRGRDGCS